MRRPQDPQGPRARSFRRWLDRDPGLRAGLRRNRLAREEDAELVGKIGVWMLVGGILLMGVGRLVTGRPFLFLW